MRCFGWRRSGGRVKWSVSVIEAMLRQLTITGFHLSIVDCPEDLRLGRHFVLRARFS